MNGLSIIQDVFKKPLQASLASNRCIILHYFIQSLVKSYFESSPLVLLVSSGPSEVSQIGVKGDLAFHYYFGLEIKSHQIKKASGTLRCLPFSQKTPEISVESKME